MGWCSLILVPVVLMHHGTLKPTPPDDITVNLNLNEATNGGHTFESHEIESEEWKTGKTTIKDLSCYKKRNQRQGQQIDEKRKRILGGKAYIPGLREGLPDYENWMASIKITTKTDPQMCGGVLVSPQHILTALHCIFDMKDEKFEPFDKVHIYFDHELHRWRGNEFKPAKYFFIKGKNKKPEYLQYNTIKYNLTYPKRLKDDIAVIKLENAITKFNRTSSLKPLKISKWSGKTIGTICEYWNAGFGTFRIPKLKPQYLQYTKKIPYIDCPELEYIRQDTMMCFVNTNKDAICPGDSGSPGVIEVNKNSWILQSIHISASNCSLPIGIALAIDVSYYRKKILEWTNQKG